MIPLPLFHNRTVAVLGLARSGLASAQALARSGARVLAWDDDAGACHEASKAGVTLADLATADPAGWDALVMSPGIPLTHPAPHPIAARALAAGVPVIGDIELLWTAGTGARFVGITGTNGKSTTTALIGHLLEQAKRPVAVGGNLGYPVLGLPTLGADGTYVIEMSSYQLDLIAKTRFEVAILLNVTPDHLDRHGDMAGYVAAKKRIFMNQQKGDTAIIGVDDDWGRTVADEVARGPARVIRISTEREIAGGVYVLGRNQPVGRASRPPAGGTPAPLAGAELDGRLIDDTEGRAEAVVDLGGIAALPGAHNWQNAAAAYAAARACGLGTEEIVAGLKSFAGLAHRQELVATLGRVRFINDSKATNADAAAKALGCYDAIHWIAGGVPKAGGIAPLAPFFPRIRHAYLIGTAAPQFQETLGAAVPSTLCGDLAHAVRAAAAAAKDDAAAAPVVLLSPACASFDQYRNFELRGDAFRAIVHGLAAEASA
jgi:UDP-N-acetylmuramoylalanine--D-glutamate ligase